MELSRYVEGLRRELGSLTRFAPDEVAKLAEQLADALESSVRLTLLEVLSAAAAEITGRLDSTIIDVRLSGGEPEFVITAVPNMDDQPVAAPEPAPDEAGTARVTLRLSEALKARIETQAAASAMSVNSWLAHAAIMALDTDATPGRVAGHGPRFGPGQRISGYARS